jgi:hypothetical protein
MISIFASFGGKERSTGVSTSKIPFREKIGPFFHNLF